MALLALPRAVAMALRADRVALRGGPFRRGSSRWDAVRDPEAIRQLQMLDRHVNALPEAPADGPLPCIEQIAAELRRLDRQRRRGPTTQSTLWLAAVLRAYDEWLRLACRSLGVDEHLHPLEGIDREIERVRLESELQANGVPLRPPQ